MPDLPLDSRAKVIDARLNDVIARYGHHLSPEQRDAVRTRIEKTVDLSAKLRETPLTNADEPEIAFAPFRGEA